MKKKKTELEDDKDFQNGVYRADWLSKIPSWVIIIILKYWAAAAVVFFIAIGGIDLGIDYSQVDVTNYAQVIGSTFMTIVMFSLGLALIFNYAVKQVVFMLNTRLNPTYRFYMINMKGLLAFLVHLVYMFVMSLLLYAVVVFMGTYGLVWNPFGTTNFGLEPFSYGFYFIIVDGIFVLVKNLIVNLVQRIKYFRLMKNPTPNIKGKLVKES